MLKAYTVGQLRELIRGHTDDMLILYSEYGMNFEQGCITKEFVTKTAAQYEWAPGFTGDPNKDMLALVLRHA